MENTVKFLEDMNIEELKQEIVRLENGNWDTEWQWEFTRQEIKEINGIISYKERTDGLMKKIKFIETALEQGEEINLASNPLYEFGGDFSELELFFLSDDMTECFLVVDGREVVIDYKRVKRKNEDIEEFKKKSCKCDHASDDSECKCVLPTHRYAEKKWYDNLIEETEKRIKEITENLREGC